MIICLLTNYKLHLVDCHRVNAALHSTAAQHWLHSTVVEFCSDMNGLFMIRSDGSKPQLGISQKI